MEMVKSILAFFFGGGGGGGAAGIRKPLIAKKGSYLTMFLQTLTPVALIRTTMCEWEYSTKLASGVYSGWCLC